LTDPVCGMTVTQESDYHIHHADTDYYFCSQGCEDKFKKTPDTYLEAEQTIQLKDPVCGMDVSKDSNFHFHHNHQDYYFCCQGCEDKFKKTPDTYLQVDKDSVTAKAESDDYCPDGTCDIGPFFIPVRCTRKLCRKALASVQNVVWL